jgi:enoyl-CoA hydratase
MPQSETGAGEVPAPQADRGTAPDDTYIRLHVDEGVAHMQFAWPATDNKYLTRHEPEILATLDRIGRDDDIRAVLVTGQGDSFGGSPAHEDDPFDAGGWYERAAGIYKAWLDLEKPIVVALNSSALLTLPLLSDIVVVERHVQIRDPHVLFGIPSATGPYLWPLSTGLARAKRHLLLGDAITAAEAERIGLVSEVVDTGQSKTAAAELARKLAQLDPVGVQKTKRMLNEWLRIYWTSIFTAGFGLEIVHFPVNGLS